MPTNPEPGIQILMEERTSSCVWVGLFPEITRYLSRRAWVWGLGIRFEFCSSVMSSYRTFNLSWVRVTADLAAAVALK